MTAKPCIGLLDDFVSLTIETSSGVSPTVSVLSMPPAGDFVDRGSWGTELLAVLAAWKLALPSAVLLLRGNHESTTCTKMYGFHAELRGKYGAKGTPVRTANQIDLEIVRSLSHTLTRPVRRAQRGQS